MTPAAQILWWFILVIGMVGTAILSGVETGVYRLSRVKLEVRAEHGPRRQAARLIRREIAKPQRLLSANLIANIICQDLTAIGASNLLAGWGYSEGAIVAINAAILTPIFFVFLESVPKEMFRLDADSLTYRFAGLLGGLRWMLTVTGVLPLVTLLSSGAIRMIGGGADASLLHSGRERIVTLLKDSAGERDSEAPLSETQAKLVDRALEFGQTTVSDEMLPWPRVQTVRSSWGRSTIMTLLARSPSPFLPVADRDATGRFKVIGIVRSQDLFTRPDAPISRLTVEPVRLPPRMTLRDAVLRLRQSPCAAGIVEESGRPIGLITMSDLIEPLLRRDVI